MLRDISLDDNVEQREHRFSQFKSKVKLYFNLDHNDIYRIGKLMMHASILFVLLVLWILHLKKFRPPVLILTSQPTEIRQLENNGVYKTQLYLDNQLHLSQITAVKPDCYQKT